MTGSRRPFIAWMILGCCLVLLSSGCADHDQCIFFTVQFEGIGHLGTTSPDSSTALGVSADGRDVVGGAADQHVAGSTSFDPGTAGVHWSGAGTASNWKPGPGAGIEKLLLCPPADLANPVRGSVRALAPHGSDAAGSVTCAGIVRPALWTATTLDLLAFPTMPVGPAAISGEALSLSDQFLGPSAIAGYVSSFSDLTGDHAPSTAVVWTDDKAGSGLAPNALLPAEGLTSARANEIKIKNLGLEGIVVGFSYDEVAGRSATSRPCGWMFVKTVVGGGPAPWRGSWDRLFLQDDAGANALGAATSISSDGKAIFGYILKNSVPTPCKWAVPASPGIVSATLLPALPGADGTFISATGLDGSVSVGHAVRQSKKVAVAFVADTPSDIKAELNKFIAGTVPADWDLLEATAINLGARDEFATLNLFSMSIVGHGLHAGVPEGWVVRIEREKLKGIICKIPYLPQIVYTFTKRRHWPPPLPPPRPYVTGVREGRHT